MCTNYAAARRDRIFRHFGVGPPESRWRDEVYKDYPAPIIRRDNEAQHADVATFGMVLRAAAAKQTDTVQYGHLRALAQTFPWLKHGMSLRFHIVECNVAEPYEVMWKVRNVGDEAVRRNQIRGQIVRDGGHRERKETANFHGPHFVECYVIKNDVCVARDQIEVPIE